MARHNDTGKLGEALACVWATENGYTIREQNWRYGKWEIDMIASKGNKLHFFEVKTRRSNRFGYPEALVDKNKLRHFIGAGTAYIRRNNGFRWIRFDILSITLDENDIPSYFLIEDVYY
ncbi:MAG: hypothetical protein RLZZ557_1176 [Bacteroidota bacterium]